MNRWRMVARRIRVPLGFAFVVFYLWLAQPTARSLAGGGAVVLLGLAVRAAASGHVVKDRELTTTGPYAYTRHPLYLGTILLAAGFAWAARSLWIAVAAAVLFAAVYLPVIRLEEYYLSGTYRERFDAYVRAVPALLPRLSAYDRGGTFSRRLYWQNREYNALFGAAAVLAALVIKMVWFAH